MRPEMLAAPEKRVTTQNEASWTAAAALSLSPFLSATDGLTTNLAPTHTEEERGAEKPRSQTATGSSPIRGRLAATDYLWKADK